MAVFDIVTPDQPPRQVALTTDAVTIGRDPECEVTLEDVGASRHHARVTRADSGCYVVEDLASKNGTRVNGTLVRSLELQDGDELVIGTSRLRFFYEAKPDPKSVVLLPEEEESPDDQTAFTSSTTKPQLSEVRLNMLYDLSERLTRLRDQDELLHDVMEICVETFGFDRAVIALVEEDEDHPVWAYKYNRMGAEEMVISQSVLRRVLEQGERVILKDPMSGEVDPTVSMVQAGIRSAMCAPIQFQGKMLGAVYGDRVTSAREYTQEEVDFLAAMGRQLSVGLTNAKLLEEHRRKVRMEGELLLAREIQRGLFPSELPKGAALEVAAINEPGLEVSGDYYDVIELSPTRVALVIGDVVGKGVAAAMLMANLQAAVRLTLAEEGGLDEMVTRWNRLICGNTQPSKFITAAVAVVDLETRELTYCNAGHLPPALIGEGQVQHLAEPAGMPLGISPQWQFEVGVVPLPPGTRTLLLYTDGVTEVMNEAGELFGVDRLTETLTRERWSNAEELIELVAQTTAQFRGQAKRSDDLTMVAVHLPGS